MPRTLLTAVTLPGAYPAAGVAAPFTAADVANGNSCVSTGREILVVFNSDSAGHTVTILSQADELSRKGDITAEAIAAGAYHYYGPLAKSGWADSAGLLEFSASHATVMFAIVQLP